MLKNKRFEFGKKELEFVANTSLLRTLCSIEIEHKEDKETIKMLADFVKRIATNDIIKAQIYTKYLIILRYEDIYDEFVKTVKDIKIDKPIDVCGFTAQSLLNTPIGENVLWAYATLTQMRKDQPLVDMAKRGFPVK